MQAMCHIVHYPNSLTASTLELSTTGFSTAISVRHEGHGGRVDLTPFLPIRCA